MLGHQAWAPQWCSPLEMIDKIIADNQGNLAQVWGAARGYSPYTIAEWFYALDELGIEIPKPDWQAGKYLHHRDCPVIKEHAARRGAGLVRFMKAAADKGLYTTFIYTSSEDEWVKRFSEVGDYYLGYDFGERFSFRLDSELLQGRDPASVTLKELADDLMARVREHVTKYRNQGWGHIMATSSNFHIDYEVEAGTDIPLIEDFAFTHLNFASALSRGLYRQYGLPLWGTHLAHEHYSWLANKSKYRMPLLRAAYYQKYMSGSKIIINESGNWFVEASLCEDSPRFSFPRVPLTPQEVTWGGSKDLTNYVPYLAEARKHYKKIDYSSPICRSYRRITSDFYDFVKAHGTPSGQPESTMALVKGRYDLSCARYMPNYAIAGALMAADSDVRWFEGVPERSWELARRELFPLHPVLGDYPNLFLSGTPHGMVDVVTFLQEELSAKTLLKHYRALIFTGWNSATQHQYRTLIDYVRSGGRLFIAIPHLSQNIGRNYQSYGVDELINGGDISELCGVRVTGRGPRFYWAIPPHNSQPIGIPFPRRFGILALSRGEIEITDRKAEILLVDDEEEYPLLLRRKLGKGEVYFLNSWAYPGAWESDDGPGGRVGSTGLMGYIYRHLAQLSRGSVWISDKGDTPGSECNYIAFSHFPESHHICLQNVDFDAPHSFTLHYHGQRKRITLAPAEFRMLDARNGKQVAKNLP